MSDAPQGAFVVIPEISHGDISYIIKQMRPDEVQSVQGTNYVYLLECADGSFYCGWTNDLAKRVAAHQAGKGGRYTRSHLPVRLVYYETADSKEAALRREAAIKKLNHKQKHQLIAQESR